MRQALPLDCVSERLGDLPLAGQAQVHFQTAADPLRDVVVQRQPAIRALELDERRAVSKAAFDMSGVPSPSWEANTTES